MESLTLVREISDPINTIGSAFYFHPDTLTRGKELGLDGFRFYFLGRGGVLGDVEPAVVVSAYGYFSTPLVTKIWTWRRRSPDHAMQRASTSSAPTSSDGLPSPRPRALMPSTTQPRR